MYIGIYLPSKFKSNYFKNALDRNANTFMFYNGSPQQIERTVLTPKQINDFNTQKSYYSIDKFCIHAPYTLNLANPNKSKRELFLREFAREYYNANKLKADNLIFHPGSSLGGDNPLKTLAESLVKLMTDYISIFGEPETYISLEMMPPKGNVLLTDHEQVIQLFVEFKKLTDLNMTKYIGICLDTCHQWNSGYNMNSTTSFNDLVARLKSANIKINTVHMNGTYSELGKAPFDRHCPLINPNSKILLEDMHDIIQNSDIKDEALWILECTNGGLGAVTTMQYLQSNKNDYYRNENRTLIKR